MTAPQVKVNVCVFIAIYHLEGHFRCVYGGERLNDPEVLFTFPVNAAVT